MQTLGVGILGCGNISTTYFRLCPLFSGIEIRACADLDPAVAEAQAGRFGLRALSVEELLADDALDIIVNLTVPDAHFEVTKAILQAGKHAYSEKPFVLSVADGEALRALSAETGLRVGSAPDTFLGGAQQQARALIDDGAFGNVASGTAMVMSHGMEHWHPNPDFFFKPGGGPVLDLGPYYIAALINLLGPVRRVAALTSAATPTRVITSAPRAGEEIPVGTPTTVQALLEFARGAAVSLIASWDVWAHRHPEIELYGIGGSLFLPDPNFFGGAVRAGGGDFSKVETLPAWEHPLGVANEMHGETNMANYRGAGLTDMARAIVTGREHRCSLELALHAVDVMTSLLKSGGSGAFVELTTTCARPEPLGPDAARALLK
ncbi:MAG: Gfo/Idh/MocA family protein [Paracoccaceae bacterium]